MSNHCGVPRRAIISAIGSRGDVNPMLALGKQLQQRGWDIVFLTSEPYLDLAVSAGFTCESVVDARQFQELINSPGMWSPFEGIRQIFSRGAHDLLRPCYAAIEKHHQPGNTILVSHLLDFAGRIFRDQHPDTPQVSVVLAPMAIRTPAEPARLTDWWYEMRWPPALVRLQYWLADTVFIRSWLANPINQFRAELGLSKIPRPLHDWYLSPDGVLGLFPDWFAPDQRYLPKHMDCTGFLLEDAKEEFTPAVADLAISSLGFVQQSPLVIFAPGTANVQAIKFFECALQACQHLGLTGIFLTEHRQQLPPSLPKNILHREYLPFGSILPMAAAIVHHGGVGTTSQALAAETPQLVVPMAFDQFDNAMRVQRLGCGEHLFSRRLNASRLTKMLKKVIVDPQIKSNCQEIAGRLDPAAAIQRSVDRIEAISLN